MSTGGLLQSVKSLVGSFVALIREDGTTELCEVVPPPTPPPPAVDIRKVASGSSLVTAFGQLQLGPFVINADEAPSVFVFGPAVNASTWGGLTEGDFVWYFKTVGLDPNTFSLFLANNNASDVTARWVVLAAKL